MLRASKFVCLKRRVVVVVVVEVLVEVVVAVLIFVVMSYTS
jgi:hypothetical protein